ncbi:MAG: magnesium/cobalt transporter CorA [Alphaproteobacteria bacterium]
MKTRLFNKNKLKKGQAPGTLQTPANALLPQIYIFAYDETNLEETGLGSPEELQPYLQKWPMLWINVDGLGDAAVIAQLGEIFQLHPLALEDVLNVPQRAKFENYESCFFLILRMIEEAKSSYFVDQLSMFCGPNFVLTFQERPGDVFDGVRDRLRKGGRIRAAKSDYMAYALIDAAIDGYFPALEKYGDQLDKLEEEILFRADKKSMGQVHKVKRSLQMLRLSAWPMREALAKMNGSDCPLVHNETRLFLRDCQDHVMQILDVIENYRERLSGLSDLYISSVSNRLNEVMKVLTVFSTIFMPLTFIVGVYGMNFDTSFPYNMPELEWAYGYPTVMAFMALIAAGMIFYFWRRGWLSHKEK